MTSPTQRTLAHLRKLGYVCAVTEHWNSFVRRRQDLFGFVDVLALDHIDHGVIGVQTTTGPNVSERMAKIEESENAKNWLACGNKVWVIGWRKVGERGKRKLWQPRRIVAGLERGEVTWTETL